MTDTDFIYEAYRICYQCSLDQIYVTLYHVNGDRLVQTILEMFHCHASLSNPAELLNSMAQIKSHGLLSNSIQQLLNSSNP